MKKIVSKNEGETFEFGYNLGRECRSGEVFILNGDLGAGKTKLIQGLAQGLGIKAKVNSPTFNIMKVYKLRGAAASKGINTLCHVDAYRLRSAQDLISLGIEEFFTDSGTVTAIEWGDKVKDIWPRQAKVIDIKARDENARELKVNFKI